MLRCGLITANPFLCLVSSGGCVAMSGGSVLGHWEVKDCKLHKASSVCKQSISSYHDVQSPEHHIDSSAPCPPGWESHSGMLYCFKVGSCSSFSPPPPPFLFLYVSKYISQKNVSNLDLKMEMNTMTFTQNTCSVPCLSRAYIYIHHQNRTWINTKRNWVAGVPQ